MYDCMNSISQWSIYKKRDFINSIFTYSSTINPHIILLISSLLHICVHLFEGGGGWRLTGYLIEGIPYISSDDGFTMISCSIK